MAEVIEGTVRRIDLKRGLWGLAEVDVGGERVTATGEWGGIYEGARVSLEGRWDHHPRWGRQFKAFGISALVPQDAQGVVAWLVNALPNVGDARARALVDRFGVDGLWSVLEREPDRLLEVDGITPGRRDAIVEAYARARTERELRVRLHGYGLRAWEIQRLLDAWGPDLEGRLAEDPYAAADEVRGFGFRRADAIARRMGVARDAPVRVRAAILFALHEAAQAGHVFLPFATMAGYVATKLCEGAVGVEDVRREFGALAAGERVVPRGDWVYLASLDVAEGNVAASLIRLAGGEGEADAA